MAFNGRFVMNIAHFAQQQGANASDLIKLSGKQAEELCIESCTLDDVAYNAVIESAVTATGDEFFGLHAGENLNLAAAGLIAQLTQTSETVKQALELCCEFANLGCSALPMDLIEEKEHYRITLTPDTLWKNKSPIAYKHTADGVLAFALKEFHSLTRMQHYPLAIHFPWPKPDNTTEYERVFSCPLHFNKAELAILLKREHVEDQVVTSNYDLLRTLILHAEEKSAKINQAQGFASVVKNSVIKLVKPEFPSIEQVSGHLNISPRTLQRRLQEEKVTYKSLIDGLRREFAISYLKRADLNINQIAYLLSYADASAFVRAFKRWTGQTPNEHRQHAK